MTGLPAAVDAVADPGWESDGHVPDEVVDLLRPTGLLGALVSGEFGGTGWTLTQYAEACRLLARTSISAQALLTTHGMVCQALQRWRNPNLAPVLAALAAGRSVGAFALTDETAGSDVRALETRAGRSDDGGWWVDGTKRWVTFGQLADVFLVFAMSDEGDVCLVVRLDDPGVSVVPEVSTSGFRAARLGRLSLDAARIPAGRLVGRPGFALAQVGIRALALGRLCVAAGAVGLAERAFDELLSHGATREQFGAPLLELGTVRSTVGRLAAELEAARLSVASAARQAEGESPQMDGAVLMAKLTATRAASGVVGACAQLHGARGLVAGSAVDRWVADARVLEIIEGSSELVADLIATQAIGEWRSRRFSEARS